MRTYNVRNTDTGEEFNVMADSPLGAFEKALEELHEDGTISSQDYEQARDTELFLTTLMSYGWLVYDFGEIEV